MQRGPTRTRIRRFSSPAERTPGTRTFRRCDRRGRVHTERAGLVVGADGRDSLVAGAVAAEVLASYDWDLAAVPTLLRTLAGTMTDEVELLAGLPVAA
jgi:2-polyprenyl-6-methoxyphenol hydroxylase-like FAD-dependent oxidoreductase